MSFPIPTTPETTVIARPDYNDIRDIVDNIIGLNTSGYGVAFLGAVPVTARNQITTSQWSALIFDMNNIHQHIYDATNSTLAPTTASVVSPQLANSLYNLALELNSNRYNIHPNQYFINTVTNSKIINVDFDTDTVQGVSTSTNTSWLQSMSHIVRMGFATEEIAQYFFNTGGKLVWNTTFDVTTGETAADTAWSNFILQLQALANPPDVNIYEYGRNQYLAGNDTVIITNTTGTLSITLTVEKTEGRLFKFTALYQDLKAGGLTIQPDGYTWRF
jgi:hypothetical protein